MSNEGGYGHRAQFRVYCSPAFKAQVTAWAAAEGSNVSEAVVLAVAAAMKAEQQDRLEADSVKSPLLREYLEARGLSPADADAVIGVLPAD